MTETHGFRLFKIAIADVVVDSDARKGCAFCSSEKKRLCPLILQRCSCLQISHGMPFLSTSGMQTPQRRMHIPISLQAASRAMQYQCPGNPGQRFWRCSAGRHLLHYSCSLSCVDPSPRSKSIVRPLLSKKATSSCL